MCIATTITFEIPKKEIKKHSENVETSSNMLGLPRAEISEAGNAKWDMLVVHV